ncbi:hypothetical protein OG874_23495 [Nocardia sp. NBC_00565]|uniref:hypothetical protein n=1 Tax=Nocardia sp. NBC_00565 TaxID=2975993 RepID=UPI002E81A611|nr:hypothetical protein [Nocardia sp. NBC_00565]WUB99884.1 hypothetical protein OG874_23495 [Nocardia sp. NBC_00565]
MRATTFLISLTLDGDSRTEPLYACAYVASIVSQPEVAAVGGKRVERARASVVERLLTGLRQGDARVEEEAFRRGEVADTWRHLSLHLAVGAVITADPHTIFEPPVRRALTGLLDLQETGPLHTHRGEFRTSAEGFVTSYATTQALEAMVTARPGFACYWWALRDLDAPTAGIVGLNEAVVASVVGVAVAGSDITVATLVAAALVLTAVGLEVRSG